MFKNVASQKITVSAIDPATGAFKTGDAANITVYVAKDDGSVTALTDTSATETDSTNAKGDYLFDLSQAETNADKLRFTGKSSTSGIIIIPQTIYTVPNSFGDLAIANNAVAANVTRLLGTAWLTPGTAGTPDVNVKLWNALATVELPLAPTTAGRKLDVSAGGEAGVDWANVGSPTTSLALTGTTIATTQKVDLETIKTNPVVNAGTVTFPTTATLASTTNITAGTIATATNVTTVNGLAAGVITATSIAADAITAAKVADGTIDAATFAAGAINAAAIAADAITDAKVASDVTIASVTGAVGSVTGAVGSVTGNVGGNVTGSVGSVVGAVGSVAGNVGGNVTGSVGSIATGGIAAASFAAGAIDASAIATDAIGSAEVSAAAVTKIQAGLATPTNITAGTITTVTNLTNAPTAGDLTATMKTSVQTASTSALTAFFTSAAQLVSDVWSATTRILTAGTNIVLAKGTGVTGFNDPTAAANAAAARTELATELARIDVATSTRGSAVTASATLDSATAIQDVTAKLDTALELDGSAYRYTTNALEQAPSGGGSAPTAAEVADAVWDEVASGHNTSGTMGAKLNAAGSASDPLDNPVPGSYAAGTAGYKISQIATASDVAADLSGRDISIQSAWDGGTLTIFDGAEYSVANGNHVDYDASTLPDLTSGTARFHVQRSRSTPFIDTALTVLNAGTPTQKIRWTLAATESIKVEAFNRYLGAIVYKTATASEYAPFLKFSVQAGKM